MLFDTCDGDEKKEKAFAYYSLLNSKDILEEVEEIPDETILQFDSYEDFLDIMKPKKNLRDLKQFFKTNNLILNAYRKINIFKVKK